MLVNTSCKLQPYIMKAINNLKISIYLFHLTFAYLKKILYTDIVNFYKKKLLYVYYIKSIIILFPFSTI